MKAFERKHIVLTNGDLIVHDGQQIVPILDNKRRRWLFRNIDSTNYQKSFIVPNYKNNEMWVCFPSTGATYADTALIWNWRDGSVGIRELPNSPHIAYGVVDPSETETWDSDSGTWDSDTTVWDERLYNPTERKLLLTENLQSDFYVGDDTNTLNGTAMTSYVERTGMDFGEDQRIKRIKKVYPRMTGTGTVNIYVGMQMQRGDAISWSGPFPFVIGTDRKIDCSVTGRYMAIKFETTTDVSWQLSSYDLDVVPMGTR